MTPLSGPTIPPASGSNPKQLIIFLHGLGADGRDLASLAPLFAEELPDAQFTSPNAPFPCDMAPFGYQWFSLMSWTPANMLEGARTAAPILNNYIDEQIKALKLKEDKVALVGFSQGTMMALHVALRRPKPIAGVVGFSGALLAPEMLPTDIVSKPPVCLIHGTADPVVPFMAMTQAEHALKKNGVPLQAHTRFGLMHGIDPDGIDIAKQFLVDVLV